MLASIGLDKPSIRGYRTENSGTHPTLLSLDNDQRDLGVDDFSLVRVTGLLWRKTELADPSSRTPMERASWIHEMTYWSAVSGRAGNMYARHAYDVAWVRSESDESCPALSSKLIPNGLNPSGNNYVGDTGIPRTTQEPVFDDLRVARLSQFKRDFRLTNMSLVTSQFELTETWLPRKSKDKPWEVDPTSLSPWKDIQPAIIYDDEILEELLKANGSVDTSNPIRRGLDALLQTIFDDNMASTREALEWLNELLMQHMPARGGWTRNSWTRTASTGHCSRKSWKISPESSS